MLESIMAKSCDGLGPRADPIKLFEVNLLNFCKLDCFTARRFLILVLWEDLAYKKVIKFIPKKFYDINPWG
jgi:hypothetical protein